MFTSPGDRAGRSSLIASPYNIIHGTTYGPEFEFLPPQDSQFAWINQGSATITNFNNSLSLTIPISGTNSLRIRKKASLVTPYTVTIAYIPSMISMDFAQLGLLFRESGSGKIVTYSILFSTTPRIQMAVSKWNSATSFSADYSIRAFNRSTVVWLRIADNGTNRICSFSNDNINWIVFHTFTRTDFITADEVGFYGNDATNTYTPIMNLLSWREVRE